MTEMSDRDERDLANGWLGETLEDKIKQLHPEMTVDDHALLKAFQMGELSGQFLERQRIYQAVERLPTNMMGDQPRVALWEVRAICRGEK